MPLETATYISDLVASNPAASDPLSNADDHIRLFKAVVKASFPNITGAVTATQAQLNALPALLTAGSGLLNHSGTFFDNGAGAASTDGFLNTVAGDIDVQLQGNLAFTFQRTGGANFFKANGGIQATGEIKGPGITPIGGTILWWDDVLPTDGLWVWANGQVLTNANVVAPILLARWGARFGGNGTTTMGLPDMRETVPVGTSQMGGAAQRGLITNQVLSVLNAIGNFFGEAAHTLSKNEMPAHFHGAGISDPGHLHQVGAADSTPFVLGYGGGPNNGTLTSSARNTTPSVTGVRLSSANGLDTTDTQGGGLSHNNVQPSTVCNYIIRIG